MSDDTPITYQNCAYCGDILDDERAAICRNETIPLSCEKCWNTEGPKFYEGLALIQSIREKGNSPI